MKQNRMTIVFRRKREGKTNYPKRIKLIASGKPRLVVRKSLKNIHAQLVQYTPKGDITLASADSRELIAFGWKINRGNIPAAYLTGLLLGKNAKGKVAEAVLDIGLQESVAGGRLYSVLKGVIDTGLDVRHGEDIIPEEKRLRGDDISAYAAKLKKEDPEAFKRFFSSYEKEIPDLNVGKLFDATKAAILSGKKAEVKKEKK